MKISKFKIIQIRRKSERAFYQELNLLTDQLYKNAAGRGLNWTSLAAISGLSAACVSRLGRRKTRYPQFMTVWKIARALGYKLEIVKRVGAEVVARKSASV
jgi:DNA-binding phage protein